MRCEIHVLLPPLIGADSLGAMAPTAKKLVGAMSPSRSIFETVKLVNLNQFEQLEPVAYKQKCTNFTLSKMTTIFMWPINRFAIKLNKAANILRTNTTDNVSDINYK